MASSPNLSSNNQFDKTKQYTQVVFQQGKPILDVDLNDMSNALQAQSTSALAEKMGYGAPQVDFREWAMTAVSTKDPDNARNEYNFAMTLGRLDTLKGVIDLHELRSSQLDSRIIFDSGRIEDNTLGLATDREFANYILKGTVTGSGSTATVIHDEHKDFSPDHRLTAYQIQEVIQPTYSTVNPVANPTEERSAIDALVRVNEGACRLRLLETNEEREITGVANGQITVGTAFSQAPSAGDEYVILPPNTLVDYKNLYDSAVSQSRSKPEGLSNLPKLVTYVQVFEEDISSDEDLTIRSSALGVETTHRTQLRWCIRVARLTTSIDGDTYNGNPVGNLKIEHINTLLNSNLLIQHHALADATDSTASSDEGALQTQYWRESNGTDITTSQILGQESPYLELGLTPAHFFNSEEYTLDRLYWAFLKAFFITNPVFPSTNIEFNDFVILNVFNSETKSNRDTADQEILSPIFYPSAYTDTTEATLTHAFLSVGNSFRRIADDTGAEPARFKSPPRVFHTQADLSVDNMKSRTLHGLRGGILYGANAPLVFSSPSSHFSFVDQMVLGMSGIGSAQGETSEGYRIPSAIDYTLANTTASLAQSGYGAGAIKMISPISASTISTGHTDGSFLSGTASYLLREKGNRTSHTVNADDADLGWSLYKQEGSDLTDDNNESDFSIRGWDEGIAQAIAFQQGINFRKLAIKTTAHKSMDLFTISETPRQQADQHDQNIVQDSSTAFQIPYLQSQEVNGNIFLDSYSGSAGLSLNDMLPSNFIPANVSRFDPKPLLQQYQSEGGIKGFDQAENADRDIAHTYGPWNRFDRADIANHLDPLLDNADAPTYSMDMWGNRCTAMRLRYHVGDFYPGADDSRGVPSNQLVDSMNLFVKVEPLSLAHWMTMPKHQHSILENSISFAEGIEALLKVAHGLGDTQKLINSSGQALVQETSPIRNNEFPLYPTAPSVGSVDPTNLPFEHHKQPFVHWYHPTMHKIKSPHPDGTNNGYDGSGLTVYPKFGRRSLIVPALVPSKFGTYTDGAGSQFPIVTDGNSGESYPELVGSDTASSIIGKTTVNVSAETGSLTINNSILPYPYHGSTPTATGETTITTDTGANITFRNNQITFPAVGTDGAEITPSPVFIPAGRSFASIPGTDGNARVGFNTLISYFKSSEWSDITELDASFPYDERLTHYSPEAGGASNVPTNLTREFNPFDVPVLKTAINTQTVSGIVSLVRTSFANGLGDLTLSSDYDFTMPENVFSNYTDGFYAYNAQQVPAIGPDNPVDTLFVGDLGTALGGFSDRAGFISPLNFGVPMRVGVGPMPNGMIYDGVWSDSISVRDSFDFSKILYANDTMILDTFNAISKMGLQQKLMWNCSFRVLHTRPGGMTSTEVSTAPKSITEVFLAHDRTDGNMTKTVFPAPSNAQKKPFIHLMSMHPQTNNLFPNKDHMEHLYPMVSDSTGGTHESTAITNGVYDYTDNVVKTSSMGDTFAVDPFDTMMNDVVFGANNPTKSSENLEKNSGIEIDLISELNMIHANLDDYDLNSTANVNSQLFSISRTMPTANELTLPGDHELVFVLYTGHYGAKMFDENDQVDISHIPPVAGCHLTATLEINRPSERISSTDSLNRHYGVTMNTANDPITTYAIPSTKS